MRHTIRLACLGVVLAIGAAPRVAHPDQGEDKPTARELTCDFRPNFIHDHWSRWWFANRSAILQSEVRAEAARVQPAVRARCAARAQARDALAAALADNSDIVAAQAALALGRAGDPRDATTLARIVTDGRATKERSLHRLAALGLGCFPTGDPTQGESIRAALLKGLESARGNADDAVFFWSNCAYALAMRGDVAAVPALVRSRERSIDAANAERGMHAAVMGAVCYALGDLAKAAALPEIAEHLSGRRSPDRGSTDTSWEAAHALARVDGQDSTASLRRAATDPRENVRRVALQALGSVCGPADEATASVLRRTLTADSDTLSRMMAAISLGRTGHADAAAALRVAFETGPALDRPCVAIGLGLWARRTHDSRTREYLTQALLASRDEDECAALSLACGLSGAVAAHDRILALARGGRGNFSPHSSYALGLLGTDAAGVRALRDAVALPGNPLARREAALALGMLRVADVVRVLRDLIASDAVDAERASAAVCLGRVGSEADVAPLVALLAARTSNDQLRASAAQALGFLLDADESRRFARVSADAMWWIDRNTPAPVYDLQHIVD